MDTIFTGPLYYGHAVTSGCVQNFHWLQREFNSTCQSRTIRSESPTVIKNILCFLPFGFLCTTGWFCGGSLLPISAQNICLEEKISLFYSKNRISLYFLSAFLNKKKIKIIKKIYMLNPVLFLHDISSH